MNKIRERQRIGEKETNKGNHIIRKERKGKDSKDGNRGGGKTDLYYIYTGDIY